MEIGFNQLDKLQLLINIEKSKYKHAIENNQKFDIISNICNTILKLEFEVSSRMAEINERYIKVSWEK